MLMLFLTTFLGGISLWLHSSLWIMNHDIYPCANCCYFDFTDLNQLVSLESLILDHNIELHLLPATLLKMENLKMIGLSWYVFFNCFQLLLLWLTEKIFVCTLTQGGGVESAHADCNCGFFQYLSKGCWTLHLGMTYHCIWNLMFPWQPYFDMHVFPNLEFPCFCYQNVTFIQLLFKINLDILGLFRITLLSLSQIKKARI